MIARACIIIAKAITFVQKTNLLVSFFVSLEDVLNVVTKSVIGDFKFLVLVYIAPLKVFVLSTKSGIPFVIASGNIIKL